MIKLNNTHGHSTRGHSLKLQVFRSTHNIRQHYFINRATNVWNGLTEEIVNAPSLNAFKARLDRHWINHPYKFIRDTTPINQTRRRENIRLGE